MSRYTLHKRISRLMAVLLAVLLLVSCIPAAFADGESGSCGADLTWSLNAGTLTITGSGAMEDFSESTMAPWYNLREEILRVELPEGLTAVGSLAFYGCENIKTVIIPDSVERIGRFAFAYCAEMEMLSLGSGVKTVGESAFSDCYALTFLRLPDSLQYIGLKAFYRCESIPSVTVPSSVTSIGMSAFGYCKSLVSADVQAEITTIPEWLFYGCESLVSVSLPDSTDTINEFVFRGCDQLNTVYYDGTAKTPEEIQQIIDSSVPGFGLGGYVTDDVPAGIVSSGKTTENEDGTVTQENTTLNQGENASVSSNILVTRPADAPSGGSYSADITITVEGDDGWQEAREGLANALKNYEDTVSGNEGTAGKIDITVYVKDTGSIDRDFINSVAGRDVTMTIVTQDGSTWQLDGTQLEEKSEGENYDLRYEVSHGTPELCQELETSVCYVLRFLAPAQINAEVMIRIDPSLALQNATLLQRDEELKRVQTTVVDNEGYAHFYLASVTEETEYYIAMNLADAEQEIIVPEALQPEYGYPEQVQPIQYEITGRTSSWGMSINQVTWILAGVMVGAVVLVGIVMFALNKRRLKAGYIPDIYDEEE